MIVSQRHSTPQLAIEAFGDVAVSFIATADATQPAVGSPESNHRR
jgi:hypothetical protein